MVTLRGINRRIIASATVILSLMIILLMTPVDVFASSTSTPKATGTITVSGGTNVRSSYNTSSTIKATIKKGSTFTVTSERFTSASSTATKYRWYYSTTYKGYVRSDLMTLTYGKVNGKTTASAKARIGAGTGFTSKYTLPKGKSVTVVLKAYDKSGNAWYKINYGGGYCYVLDKYVTLGAVSTDTTNTSNTAKVVKTVSKSSTYGTINTADVATVRKSYSSTSSSLGTVAKGTICNVTSERFTSSTSKAASTVWYYSPTYKGYIKSDQVTITPKTTKGTTTGSVNMRIGAGTGFSTKSELSSGAVIYKVMNAYDKSGNKWYKIKSGSSYYYIYSTYVTFKTSSNTVASDYEQSLIDEGFPASYASKLATLHAKYPNWVFKPVLTGINWSDAIAKMTASNGSNTIHTVYAPSYRSTDKGCYNYLKNTYTIRDGSSYVTASKKAVYYYMDPRNWLDASSIFMFEDQTYHSSYQTLELVQEIVENNAELYNHASYFVTAGKKYNISPVYLASKSYNELGTSDFMINGHQFTYGGITYDNCYNAYNIGASDGSNAALKGLVYANGGSVKNNLARGTATSYGRAWSSIYKAIVGGANYLSSNFIGNNQSSGYLEHFNVLNGLSNVGTHEYMTAVYAPNSMAYSVYENYNDYGIMNKSLEFYIPVYTNMPSTVCKKPSTSTSKDNNYYLKTLSFTDGTTSTGLIKSSKLIYTTTFNNTVANSVSSITINADAASTTAATVTGTGTFDLSVGVNTFKIKCKSSSGQTRTYIVNITRSAE